MRVAAIQFKPEKGNKGAALARLAQLAEHAARPGVDLLVLPEMAATGYVFEGPEEVAPLAEPPEGETFDALSAVALRHRTWLVVGLPERAGDRLFNSALVIDPSGALKFTYRKTMLFEVDETWATPGDSGYASFDTDAGRFTVGICMDLNDDRFIDWCAKTAARAIAFPTNWLDQGRRVWGYWAWRLAEVPSALVAANTYGPEGEIRFRGESCVLHERTILAWARRTGDAILRVDLDDPALAVDG